VNVDKNTETKTENEQRQFFLRQNHFKMPTVELSSV